MTGKQKRVGLLGGSFDPVHIGHLAAARAAMAFSGLDRVVFIPAALSPFKTENTPSPGVHRLEMLRLATASEPQMCVSDVEIVQAGISYTIDTVRHFMAALPGAKLFFIIGADALETLHTWKDAQTLVELCAFITLARSGCTLDTLPGFDAAISERLLRGVVRDFRVEASSSEIRRRVAVGASIVDCVHPDVACYISEHGLYGGNDEGGRAGSREE